MLEVVGASKRYGGVTALADCTFAARPGRLLGLLGPNGAGKTTAMRAIIGLVELDGGEVLWRGRAIDARDRRAIGYLPEQRGLYPRMPVGEQVQYLGRLHGLGAADAATRTAQLLTRVGLDGRAADRVEQLSHGNQQRAQLAAALVHDPELLVLDEPFSGLDPVGVGAMRDLVVEHAGRGSTVVFSSHQLDLVQDICQDVAIIAAGQVVAADSLDEVRDAVGHRVLVVDADGPLAALTAIGGVSSAGSSSAGRRFRVEDHLDPVTLVAAAAHDSALSGLSWERPSLSEVFIERVGAAPEAAAMPDAPDATDASGRSDNSGGATARRFGRRRRGSTAGVIGGVGR